MIEHLIQRALRAPSAPGPCPDAETLAAYVDHALSGGALRACEEHLAGCPVCLDQVMLCTAAGGNAVPVSPRDVVVRFLEHAVEAVRGIAEIQLLPAPALVAVRSIDEEPAALKCVRFGREFAGLAVSVEVEASSGGRGEIRVEGVSAGASAEPLRITLLDEQRELDSTLARGGPVVFDDVEFGDYVIRLSRRGHTIGEVSLRLERG